MNIIVKSTYEIKDRGLVFVIDLEENNLPKLRKELDLKDKEIIVDSKNYTIIGIELADVSDYFVHKTAGLLVKQIK